MNTWKRIAVAASVSAMLAGSMFGCARTENRVQLPGQSFLHFTSGDAATDALLTDEKYKKSTTLAQGVPLEIRFEKPTEIDTVLLYESGDHANWFTISAQIDGAWQTVYEGDRVLAQRLCWFEPVVAEAVRVEVTDCIAPVELTELAVYKGVQRETPVRVSQYLRLDRFCDLTEEQRADISGYFDVVTDVMLFGGVQLDATGRITFEKGEAFFAENLQSLRTLLQGRDVKIRTTVFFDQLDENGERSHNATKQFILDNPEIIAKSLKTLVQKYNLDGLDFDWEYPTKAGQWRAYSRLVVDTAEFTSVSVALPPWGIRFSAEAREAIDFVNVMAYDLFDERGDHANSYIAGADAIEKVHKAGFAYEQIFLGIPTYGRTVDKSGDAWPEYKSHPELGKWNGRIEQFAYTDASTGEEKTAAAYVDSFAESRDKTVLAADTGCGGVMIFRALCDAPYTYTYAIHRGIGEAVQNRNPAQE